jgi:hypothetical protein
MKNVLKSLVIVLAVAGSMQAVQLSTNIGDATKLSVTDIAALQQSDLAAHKELLKDFKEIGDQLAQLRTPSTALATSRILMATVVSGVASAFQSAAYAMMLDGTDVVFFNKGVEVGFAAFADIAGCMAKVAAMNMGDLPMSQRRLLDELGVSVGKSIAVRNMGIMLSLALKNIFGASLAVQGAVRIGAEILSVALDCVAISLILNERCNDAQKRAELEEVRAKIQAMMVAVQSHLHGQATIAPQA